MNEHPILFSAPMVRALLAGTKTQTRRVMKPAPVFEYGVYHFLKGKMSYCIPDNSKPDDFNNLMGIWGVCPYGVPGDRLWVKEAHILTPPCWSDSVNDYNVSDDHGEGRICVYTATCPPGAIDSAADYHLHPRPAMFMPRWASRITLEVTGVRVERVTEISRQDAIAEGLQVRKTREEVHYAINEADPYSEYNPAETYARLWDSINKKNGFSWAANPWVWSITFRVIKPEIIYAA